MATTTSKTTTKTAAAKKGTTMTKTAVNETAKPKMTRDERIAENDARIADYKKKYGEPKLDGVVNIFHVLNAEEGRCAEVKPLFVNDQWVTILSYMAYEKGWETNGFITKTQLYILHGEASDEDMVTAFGPNYRPQNLWHESSVTWEFGEPMYDEERAAEVNKQGTDRRNQSRKNRKHKEMAAKVFKATINGIEFTGTLKELQDIRDEMGIA